MTNVGLWVSCPLLPYAHYWVLAWAVGDLLTVGLWKSCVLPGHEGVNVVNCQISSRP